jgi:hypothetical protein
LVELERDLGARGNLAAEVEPGGFHVLGESRLELK